MARNKDIDIDDFAIELGSILDDVDALTKNGVVSGIRKGAREGAKIWRKHARDRIGTHQYKRNGEIVTSGKYAKSIRSHMIFTDGRHPTGEIGSPKMSGLTHLLQDGHARIGGGRVNPVLSLDTEVVPQTFKASMDAVEEEIDNALNGVE